MHKDLQEIPRRMRELREILEISALDMATRLNIPLAQYEQYEQGQADIPISTLYEVAGILNVDFTELITGEAPRMDSYSITRAGKGAGVDRYGYACCALAYNFIDREMEPMLVTLTMQDKPAPMVTHSGQEFNYVLTGKMRLTINGREHILCAGDSIYFDPALPHGQSAVDGTATFLTVIKE